MTTTYGQDRAVVQVAQSVPVPAIQPLGSDGNVTVMPPPSAGTMVATPANLAGPALNAWTVLGNRPMKSVPTSTPAIRCSFLSGLFIRPSWSLWGLGRPWVGGPLAQHHGALVPPCGERAGGS